MMFRNSYRLLLANFGTFWKNLLYKAIVICLVLLLTWPVFGYVKSLPTAGQFASVTEQMLLAVPFNNLPAYFDMVYDFLIVLFATVGHLFSTHIWVGIYLSLLYLVVLPFLLMLSTLAVSEVLYGYMASQTKYGFSASFVQKIGKSSVYSIFYTLIMLPFAALTVYAIWGLLHLYQIGILPILVLPILLLIVGIGIMGFGATLFCGWAPSIIVFNCRVWRAFGKGMIAVFRRFFKSFSTVAMIMLVSVLVAQVFGALSLVLILPLFTMNMIIFQMVMFFGSQGMRYYVDPDTILTPKKLEETDKYKKTKNII